MSVTFVHDFGSTTFHGEMQAFVEDETTRWLPQETGKFSAFINAWALADWEHGFEDDAAPQKSLNDTILDLLIAKHGPHFAGYRIDTNGSGVVKFEILMSDNDKAAMLLKLAYGGAARANLQS
ncbi:hypothetical protein [Rhizobium sp. 2MFCol3.1]|uniref:hypothetical protein n=1 Tax=Rhizobium sp. 2MFCol3.1 TaxID=1246459 RepID=UPI000378C69A|nr:hypothetical protein [Rhizobium sp. 2MFCol3.1]